MAELSCDILGQEVFGKSPTSCSEEYAGLGRILYAVDPEDLIAKPTYETASGKMRFTEASFGKSNFYKDCYAYAFRGKKDTNQNQGTGNEGARKGASQSLTFTIEQDLEASAAALRVIKNRGDFYWIVQYASGMYQVVGDPDRGSDLNFNYDSGTDASSDSGLAATVSCSAAPSPVVFWEPGEDDELPTFNNKSVSEKEKPTA